jgi:hypothetical protein
MVAISAAYQAGVLDRPGLGLVPWSPLAYGLLTGKYDRAAVEAGPRRRDGVPNEAEGVVAVEALVVGRACGLGRRGLVRHAVPAARSGLDRGARHHGAAARPADAGRAAGILQPGRARGGAGAPALRPVGRACGLGRRGLVRHAVPAARSGLDRGAVVLAGQEPMSNTPAWYAAEIATMARLRGRPMPVGLQEFYSLADRGAVVLAGQEPIGERAPRHEAEAGRPGEGQVLPLRPRQAPRRRQPLRRQPVHRAQLEHRRGLEARRRRGGRDAGPGACRRPGVRPRPPRPRSARRPGGAVRPRPRRGRTWS